MKDINMENLDTAIALGDAVCEDLGICCDKRGQVIFKIYKKLEEVTPKKDASVTHEPSETQAG